MNKHIELVKKWLADPESVTQEELKANAEAAAAYAEAYATAAWAAEDAATYAAAAAAHWVKKYEEMIDD